MPGTRSNAAAETCQLEDCGYEKRNTHLMAWEPSWIAFKLDRDLPERQHLTGGHFNSLWSFRPLECTQRRSSRGNNVDRRKRRHGPDGEMQKLRQARSDSVRSMQLRTKLELELELELGGPAHFENRNVDHLPVLAFRRHARARLRAALGLPAV